LLLLGNRLRFCDVDPETLTLDPEAVRRAVSRRSKAILAVDLFGVPCDSAGLRQVADEYGLHYISDSAQSLGAQRQGQPSGKLADAAVVSFTSGKTLFAGEGGAVITDNDNLYRRLLWLTQHPHRQRRELGLALYNEVNLNGRIHPLSAIWANAVFADSLSALREWQETCFALVAHLNEIGMTELIAFRDMAIEPSFFKLTATLLHGRGPQEVSEALALAGLDVDVQRSPITPIYQHTAFELQFDRQVSGTDLCPVAEDQVTRRISIRFCR
jgi:dTDP-4-amino-4,6-dideoxygalactose transaminase